MSATMTARIRIVIKVIILMIIIIKAVMMTILFVCISLKLLYDGCLSCAIVCQVLLLSMKDMNVAKLSSVDLPLFSGIVSDLFPGIETPVIDYSKV